MARLLLRFVTGGGFLIFFTTSWVAGQEVRFSQYNAAPVLLNPGSPGTVADPTLGLNYRVQQLGILAYKTGYFSAMLPVYADPDSFDELPVGGIGVGILSDLAGEQNELQTYQFDLGGAYNLRLNRAQTHYITFGLQASYQQTYVTYGDLTWPSQITYQGFAGPSPPDGAYASRVGAFRFNTGLIWTFDPMRNAWKKLVRYRLHVGAAVSNLNRPDYSFLRDGSHVLPKVYKFHGGGQFNLTTRLSLSPGFFVIAQESLIQYAGGGTLRIHTSPNSPNEPADFQLLLGSWYRYQDAIVLLIGASSRQVEVALSYDANASFDRKNIPRQHTLELSLAYRFLRNRTPENHPTPLF